MFLLQKSHENYQFHQNVHERNFNSCESKIFDNNQLFQIHLFKFRSQILLICFVEGGGKENDKNKGHTSTTRNDLR